MLSCPPPAVCARTAVSEVRRRRRCTPLPVCRRSLNAPRASPIAAPRGPGVADGGGPYVGGGTRRVCSYDQLCRGVSVVRTMPGYAATAWAVVSCGELRCVMACRAVCRAMDCRSVPDLAKRRVWAHSGFYDPRLSTAGTCSAWGHLRRTPEGELSLSGTLRGWSQSRRQC